MERNQPHEPVGKPTYRFKGGDSDTSRHRKLWVHHIPHYVLGGGDAGGVLAERAVSRYDLDYFTLVFSSGAKITSSFVNHIHLSLFQQDVL
ncbi:uncharacterized protein METZ01_LOCUS287368 [marine metagenome]|uniref:Uncharacterized protein n=1 Tax=marine metagenome TaxID=408172 RepID=A0A382LC93_9ZZZZ